MLSTSTTFSAATTPSILNGSSDGGVGTSVTSQREEQPVQFPQQPQHPQVSASTEENPPMMETPSLTVETPPPVPSIVLNVDIPVSASHPISTPTGENV